MTVSVPLSLNCSASSGIVYKGLVGTSMAPILKSACRDRMYCGTLGAMIATRSPFCTPRPSRALAILRARLLAVP